MNKSTITLLIITLLVALLIGLGLWRLNVRQDTQGQKNAQTANERTDKTYTIDEVASHNSRADCWTVISGQVYELSDFITRHPGGDDIVRACGVDATSLFTKRQTEDGQPIGSGSPHSQTASQQLAALKIGTLAK